MSKQAAALEIAARQFRMYEEQHRAKGTEEADRKAAVNQAMAEMCENALKPEVIKAEELKTPAFQKEGPVIVELKRDGGINDMVTAIWSDGERTTMSLRNYPGEDEATIRGRLEQQRLTGG